MRILKLCLAVYLVAAGGLGCTSFGKAWGRSMMSKTNSEVKDGYFIDRDNGVQFKMPNDSYVYGSYIRTGKGRRVALSSEEEADWATAFIVNIIYAPADTTTSHDDVISTAVADKLRFFKQENFFRNLSVEANEIIRGGVSGRAGVLRLTFQTPYEGDTVFVEEYRVIVKDNFVVTCSYRNREELYKQDAVDTLMNEIMGTFSLRGTEIASRITIRSTAFAASPEPW